MFSEVPNVTSNETLDTLRNVEFPPYSNTGLHSVGFVVCLTGVLTNLNNLIVFTRPEMKKNTLNFLLTVLAISDIVFSSSKTVANIVYFAARTNSDFVYIHCLMDSYGQAMVNYATLLFSLWLNVLIGVFRLTVITWPLRAKSWCTSRRAKIAVSTIAVMALVITLPTQYIAVTSEELSIPKSLPYRIVSMYFYGPLMCVLFALPVLILLGITTGLIRSMRLASILQRTLTQRSADASVQNIRRTRMLTVILVVFLLTNSPSSLLLVAVKYSWFVGVSFFYSLQELDKPTTFFIYLIMCRRYRTAWRKSYGTLFRCKK